MMSVLLVQGPHFEIRCSSEWELILSSVKLTFRANEKWVEALALGHTRLGLNPNSPTYWL